MKQIKAIALYWKMVLWRGGWRTVRAFLTTVFIGTVSVNWGSLSGSEKLVIIVGGLVAAGDALDGFLDQTMTKMRESKIVPAEQVFNFPADPNKETPTP
jgi:hypothetical protein